MSVSPPPTALWQRLEKHRDRLAKKTIAALFTSDPERLSRLRFCLDDCLLDGSRNRLDSAAFDDLLAWAEACQLPQWIQALFNGEAINNSEDRAALHTALRSQHQDRRIRQQVKTMQDAMESCCQRVESGQWLGFDNQPIRHIIHLGIGGSMLGPQLAIDALQAWQGPQLSCDFVSSSDPDALATVLQRRDARACLFVIASKSFRTEETLSNAIRGRHWLRQQGCPEDLLERHFIAICARSQLPQALAFGIAAAHCLTVEDWVGGRFSLWSAMGLPVALALGMTTFRRILAGAAALDDHFQHAPLTHNLPVAMALIGLWNHSILRLPAHSIVPYSWGLRGLPAYLQQLEMESNGKRVDRHGRPLSKASAPLVWGGSGPEGQHAFFQWLHQGCGDFSCEFVLPLQAGDAHDPLAQQQNRLRLSQCLAQAETLLHGEKHEKTERQIPGDKAVTMLLFKRLDPYRLGQLLALYEHKVFVHGILLNINSFDQWGVERGKAVARQIQPLLSTATTTAVEAPSNPSTVALIDHCRRHTLPTDPPTPDPDPASASRTRR